MVQRVCGATEVFVMRWLNYVIPDGQWAQVLVHNCPMVHEMLSRLGDETVGGAGPAEWYIRYAKALRHAVAILDQRSLPMVPSLQASWLSAELSQATRRLAETTRSLSASALLGQLLNTMRVGEEVDHLRQLLRYADHRGGEVRLSLLDEAGDQQLVRSTIVQMVSRAAHQCARVCRLVQLLTVLVK